MQDLLARARRELRHEPIERRVRANLGAEAIVDSTRAILVWEPRRVVPSYAVPVEDIRAELSMAPATGGQAAGVLHPGIPFRVHTAAGEPVSIDDRVGAGVPACGRGSGRLRGARLRRLRRLVRGGRADRRPPARSVPSRRRPPERTTGPDRGGRRRRGRDNARAPAVRDQPAAALLPAREDVRVELHPNSRRTYCPYKGQASYWSVDVGGRRREDLGWTYEQPLPDAVAITGLVAFWGRARRRVPRRRAARATWRRHLRGAARRVRRLASGPADRRARPTCAAPAGLGSARRSSPRRLLRVNARQRGNTAAGAARCRGRSRSKMRPWTPVRALRRSRAPRAHSTIAAPAARSGSRSGDTCGTIRASTRSLPCSSFLFGPRTANERRATSSRLSRPRERRSAPECQVGRSPCPVCASRRCSALPSLPRQGRVHAGRGA